MVALNLLAMIGRTTFLPSLAYNVIMERLSARRWWDRIDGNVVLGALPFRGAMSKQIVQQEGIQAVVSMNEDYELRFLSNQAADWRLLGVHHFCQLATADIFQSPSQDKLKRGVDFMLDLVRRSPSASIYVHCKAGRTRSATLVACYLIQRYNLSPDAAVQMLQHKRPHILLFSKQWHAIRNFQPS